jgi:hypothetical protein
MKRILALIGILIVVALVATTTAFAAGSSTCQGYHTQAPCPTTTTGTTIGTTVNTSTVSTSPTTATVATTSSGTLPFTGLDIVLLVAGGGTLLVGGFVVRRLSRRLDH